MTNKSLESSGHTPRKQRSETRQTKQIFRGNSTFRYVRVNCSKRVQTLRSERRAYGFLRSCKSRCLRLKSARDRAVAADCCSFVRRVSEYGSRDRMNGATIAKLLLQRWDNVLRGLKLACRPRRNPRWRRSGTREHRKKYRECIPLCLKCRAACFTRGSQRVQKERKKSKKNSDRSV